MAFSARAVLIILLLLCSSLTLSASDSSADASNSGESETSPTSSQAPIQDNSLLIEEAYNQEDGVVQHITYVQRSFLMGDWVYSQTDEWPVRSLKHQLSLTMSAVHAGASGGFGLGDTAINYRYQLVGTGEATFAVAPRLSLLLPTGSFRLGRGNGGLGLQTNVPFSWQHSRYLVTHWNAGLTWGSTGALWFW